MKGKLKFSIEDVEMEFGITLKRNASCLGLDTASKTGYCRAQTTNKDITLDLGYFNVDVSKVKQKTLKRRILAEHIYENLKNLLVGQLYNVVVIEDVFHGINAHTTILLARIGGIAYALSKHHNTKDIMWRTASEARKTLGLKGNGKKKEIMAEVNGRLRTSIKNDNVVDAIILALNGLKEE